MYSRFTGTGGRKLSDLQKYDRDLRINPELESGKRRKRIRREIIVMQGWEKGNSLKKMKEKTL